MQLLEEFYSEIEAILLTQTPLQKQLQQLRSMLGEYLQLNEFKLECIASILESIELKPMDSPWICPHIYYHDILKFSVRLIFWPSFYENNPHEHKTWSVTGIVHNELTISTYQKKIEPLQLIMDKFLQTGAGQTGYLLPGCIHKIANPSHDLSASIHIFNNLDILNPEGNAIWYPAARRFNLTAGLVERALTTCLEILSGQNTEEAQLLIEKIFHIAPLSVKLKALVLLYQYDQSMVYDYFNSSIMTRALSGGFDESNLSKSHH